MVNRWAWSFERSPSPPSVWPVLLTSFGDGVRKGVPVAVANGPSKLRVAPAPPGFGSGPLFTARTSALYACPFVNPVTVYVSWSPASSTLPGVPPSSPQRTS